MSKIKPPWREYNFNDSHLIQLSDGTLILIDRDGAHFLKRGYTPAKIANLQQLRDTFAATKPDNYYLAIVAVKTELKDTARTALTTSLRTIFVAAENVYGAGSPMYNTFGSAALTKYTDEELFRNSQLVVDTARENLLALADEGITEDILVETEALILSFSKAVGEQLSAIRIRDVATTDRITKGNALYRAVVKACNTGKDIWYEKDESMYNDYVIYNTASGQPEPTGFGSVRGTVTDATGNKLEGVACTFVNAKITVETDEFGEYEYDKVPVGKDSMEFVYPGYVTYVDEVVEVFENQETINDVEMEKDETPAPPET